MKISRERIEKIRAKWTGSNEEDDLLAAIDERDEMLSLLRDRTVLLHSVDHGVQKENCATCLEIYEAHEFLQGSRFGVK